MASLDRNTDADVEIEVDIAEEYERPASRLGFFGNPSDELLDFTPDAEVDMRPTSPPPSLMRTPDVRRGWTSTLFRKLSPLKISKPSAEPIIQEEEASEDVYYGLSLSDEEADSDDDDDLSFLPLQAIVHQPKPSPIVHRYNCLPSPLNENPTSRSFFFGNPPRHEYTHRGRSRNSLQTTKSFWLRREEVYLEAAYTGISPNAPSTSTALTPASPPPPLSVHPRRGDLASLHDPFCVHMDRYFVGMPPWTISKALWMFDMHTAEEGQRKMRMSEPPSPTSATSEEGSESDSEDGDVSDETLVASDSDCELSTSPVKRLTKTFMRPVVEPGPARLPWETNWYRRTELLLQLTRQ